MKVNKGDKENIRKNLANDNKILGLSNEKLVRVESDSRYSNPNFINGSTPFQAGTQVIHVMCKNMTQKIISLYTGNKLCPSWGKSSAI